MLVAEPDTAEEATYAAAECWDKLRSPRPPLLKHNWACCHAVLGRSIDKQSEKHWRTSMSKKCKPSEGRERPSGGPRSKYSIFDIEQNAQYELNDEVK